MNRSLRYKFRDKVYPRCVLFVSFLSDMNHTRNSDQICMQPACEAAVCGLLNQRFLIGLETLLPLFRHQLMDVTNYPQCLSGLSDINVIS